jgi:hypothetical protein
MDLSGYFLERKRECEHELAGLDDIEVFGGVRAVDGTLTNVTESIKQGIREAIEEYGRCAKMFRGVPYCEPRATR